MATKTLKNCLVASGPLVLFLVITATTVLQHTDAICDDEWDACFNDAVCNSCYYDWAPDQDIDAYVECIDDYPDIDYGAEIDWCFFTAASYCCEHATNANGYDCLGNRAFVEHSICNVNYFVTEKVGSGCDALTCNDGSVAVLSDDDAGVVDDDTGVDNDDDADIVGDDTGVDSDDDADIVGDDAGVVGDDAGIAGDAGGAFCIGSSSPSIVLMVARGLTVLVAAAPFLAASL